MPVGLAAPLLAGLADLTAAGLVALAAGLVALVVFLVLLASVAAIDNTDLRMSNLMVIDLGVGCAQRWG